MKMSLKFGAVLLCVAALSAGFTSCKDEETPAPVAPTVATVNAISGSVSAMNGDPIEGATVTISGPTTGEMQSGSNGEFYFSGVKPGTYTITVEAPGKISSSYTVTIADDGNGHTAVWNAVLAGENSQMTINITNDQGGKGEETSEALTGNEEAEIPITVEVPAEALNVPAGVDADDINIYVVPIYNSEEGKLETGRADEQVVLIGANVSCDTEGVELKKPIDLTFTVDEQTIEHITAKRLDGDNWVDVTPTINGNEVTIPATQFTSYALFGLVEYTERVLREQALTMNPSEWDNLNGVSPMRATTSQFEYMVGMKRNDTAGGSVFKALLIEALARRYGVNYFSTTSSYPLNVTVPVGVYLGVSGKQTYRYVSARLGHITVSGTHYGDVVVTTRTLTSDHNGGGSIPGM